jgi:predicted nucleic acid-binding protein
MHKQRIYIDTSVIGGCCDDEFAKESRTLFEMACAGTVTLLISDLLIRELAGAPAVVRQVLEASPEDAFELVTVTEEVEFLRDCYMEAAILGDAARNDALHIATATVYRADLVVSWNFRHIVHVEKIRRFNAVNLVQGYQPIDIRSPKEVILP